MIDYTTNSETGVVHVKVTGKPTADEIDRLGEAIDEFIEQNGGSLRGVLMEIEDCSGYADMEAFLHDYRFIKTHHQVIGRVAIVGHKKWQEWLAAIFRPFVKAEQKYFDVDQLDDAVAWVEQ